MSPIKKLPQPTHVNLPPQISTSASITIPVSVSNQVPIPVTGQHVSKSIFTPESSPPSIESTPPQEKFQKPTVETNNTFDTNEGWDDWDDSFAPVTQQTEKPLETPAIPTNQTNPVPLEKSEDLLTDELLQEMNLIYKPPVQKPVIIETVKPKTQTSEIDEILKNDDDDLKPKPQPLSKQSKSFFDDDTEQEEQPKPIPQSKQARNYFDDDTEPEQKPDSGVSQKSRAFFDDDTGESKPEVKTSTTLNQTKSRLTELEIGDEEPATWGDEEDFNFGED